jgi:cytochrome c-type biogenesis protein
LAILGGNGGRIGATGAFICGFTCVFVALSIVFSRAFMLAGSISRYINIGSGVIVIVLGLNVIFDFFSFLNYEKRFHLKNRPRGLIGTFLAGAAFGAGWTPCVGPILGSILLLAGQSGKALDAGLYLAFYSMGLGLPFLLAALFFNRFMKVSVRLRNHLPLIRRISGVLLIVIGLTMITGQFTALNGWLQKFS